MRMARPCLRRHPVALKRQWWLAFRCAVRGPVGVRGSECLEPQFALVRMGRGFDGRVVGHPQLSYVSLLHSNSEVGLAVTVVTEQEPGEQRESVVQDLASVLAGLEKPERVQKGA